MPVKALAIRLALVAGLVLTAAAPADAQYEAARHLAEAERLLAGQPGAENQAWNRLRQGGAPWVEPHPFEPGKVRLTFLFRAPQDAISVRLDSVLNGPYARQPVADYEADFLLPLKRIARSRIWALSLDAPARLEAVYSFRIETADGSEQRSDPLNPAALQGRDAESVLVVAPRPEQRWSLPRSDVRHEVLELESAALGRRVRLELARASDAEAPLLILYDAFTWGVRAPAAGIAANLAEAGRIGPVHVVLIDELDGASAARAYADQAEFLAEELLPALRENGLQPRRVIAGGASRRGLSAAIAGLSRPDAVTDVISLSGSFYWAPEGEAPLWLTRDLPPAGADAPRFHLAAGVMETVRTTANQGHVMLEANRAMAQALSAAGYEAELRLYPGGHDAAGWRGALAEALIALLSETP
jgi:enterochelin esterase family protein